MTWKRFSEAEKADIWDSIERGESMRGIARRLGRAHGSIRTFLVDNAGRRPRPPGSSDLRLTLGEREEISRGPAAGLSLRTIATGMGRAPSTVCREVNANGGRSRYRALHAERSARRRARRPKLSKLARCRRLRLVVEAGLENYWSPEEISAWLALEYPDDPEMRVSHESPNRQRPLTNEQGKRSMTSIAKSTQGGGAEMAQPTSLRRSGVRRSRRCPVDLEQQVVDVAPPPVLARAVRTHDGMVGVYSPVRGGVAVRRAVAAAHMSAGGTQAQVHPLPSDAEAILAPVTRKAHFGQRIHVLAGLS